MIHSKKNFNYGLIEKLYIDKYFVVDYTCIIKISILAILERTPVFACHYSKITEYIYVSQSK